LFGSKAALWHAFSLVLAQALLVFVIGTRILGRLVLGEHDPFEAQPASFLLFGAVAVVDLVLIFWLGTLKLGRLRASDLGWTKFDVRSHVAPGLLGAAVGVLVMFGVVELFFGQARALLVSITQFAPEQRVFFLLVGCQAAVVEETIFRGYLQRNLEVNIGRVGSIVCTSIVFALFHLSLHPAGLLVKFLFGVIFGVLWVRSQSLWPPAIAHALIWLMAGSA
jgi:membrane protease YdiL (CAAX protease family)